MEKIKERDYTFDAFRGILMLSIPMSHFTRMSGGLYASLYTGGGFDTSSLGGFIYVTINVFVMQAFMFLSGYFSKNTERARETAFQTFLWPYMVFSVVYFGVRCVLYGTASLEFLYPAFALWFLFALFFYRYFLKDMAKFQWLLPMSIAMMLIVGQVKNYGHFMELQRLLSYLPFFLIGFYCSKERMAWIQKLKTKPVVLAILGVCLVGISIVLINFGPPVEWYLMRKSVQSYPSIPWYGDTLLRIMLILLSSAWIVFMINIIPNKKNFLTYVGTHTMPVYVFHLAVRQVIKTYGVYMGACSCLVIAWFAMLSLVFRSKNNKKAYAVAVIVSIAGFVVLFASGCLEPIYYSCPENKILYYIMVCGSAILTGVSLVSPFWVKFYDILVDGPAHMPRITKWLKGPKA